MNNFLLTRDQIDLCTKNFQDRGLTESGLSAKNWETAQVLPRLKEGNILDMGSDGSILLENATKIGIKGFKVGIDLAYPENKILPDGTNLVKGDLMDTPFPGKFFTTITCLSVIEHQVLFDKLAKECSRLLVTGGQLFLSFDYFEPKPDTENMKLYSLDWNILNKNDVIRLVATLAENGLVISGEIDWTLQDAVINDSYCSPAKNVSYTFGILEFIKQ